MSMLFKFKNVNERGVKKHLVTRIEGVLDRDKLPLQYTRVNREDAAIWKSGNGVQYWDTNNGYVCIYPGEILTTEHTGRLLDIAAKAGHRLHDINMKIKKDMENWEGKEWEVKI